MKKSTHARMKTIEQFMRALHIDKQDVEAVNLYHNQTKHSFKAYSRASNDLDWRNQPNPFRTYEGSRRVKLDVDFDRKTPYNRLYFPVDQTEATPLNVRSLSELLYFSMSLSAEKKHRKSSWFLRVNPSSGNLHPLEAYVILDRDLIRQTTDRSAVYHYNAESHVLEERSVTQAKCMVVRELLGNLFSNPASCFMIGLSSIHWRESWKYGERAFRYTQLDMGHAIAAIKLSAHLLGWKVAIVRNCDLNDDTLDNLIGTNVIYEDNEDAPDREHPEVLLLVETNPTTSYEEFLKSVSTLMKQRTKSENVQTILNSMNYFGIPNVLSSNPYSWKIIHLVAELCRDHREVVGHLQELDTFHTPINILQYPPHLHAQSIIRQRRSAMDFDKSTSISDEIFFSILSKVVPSLFPQLWSSLYCGLYSSPRVHLAIFVHRIDGLEPGLYLLLRDPTQLEELQQVYSKFTLISVHETLPLYKLWDGNCQDTAKTLSCGQDIAADGVFGLSMVSTFEQTLSQHGPVSYKHLHWESGFIGHILYLESEAHGIRSTGMGCYFDDETLEVLMGKEHGMKYQDMYHFGMGKPVEDSRLQTVDPYLKLRS